MPILYWYAPYINCFGMASVSIMGIQVATQASGENRRCGGGGGGGRGGGSMSAEDFCDCLLDIVAPHGLFVGTTLAEDCPDAPL